MPEEPEGEGGQGGGVMMGTDSAALYEQVRRRYEERGEATDGIHYLIFHSMEELRASPDLLEGARAMVGRVLAGQDWWVEGGRSRCELAGVFALRPWLVCLARLASGCRASGPGLMCLRDRQAQARAFGAGAGDGEGESHA